MKRAEMIQALKTAMAVFGDFKLTDPVIDAWLEQFPLDRPSKFSDALRAAAGEPNRQFAPKPGDVKRILAEQRRRENYNNEPEFMKGESGRAVSEAYDAAQQRAGMIAIHTRNPGGRAIKYYVRKDFAYQDGYGNWRYSGDEA